MRKSVLVGLVAVVSWGSALGQDVAPTGPVSQGFQAESTAYTIVEVTEKGYWLQARAKIGMTQSLLGGEAAQPEKFFVPWGARPLEAQEPEVEEAIHTLANEIDPAEVERAKRVLIQTLKQLGEEAKTQATAALRKAARIQRSMARALRLAPPSKRSAAEAAERELARFEQRMRRQAEAGYPGRRAHRVRVRVVEVADSVGKEVGTVVASVRLPRLSGNGAPLSQDSSGVASASNQVARLNTEARAFLAGEVSRYAVLRRFRSFEIALKSHGKPPPTRAAELRAFRSDLAEGRALFDAFRRRSYSVWSPLIENDPARAMAELSDFRYRHRTDDLQATGHAWSLLNEARRAWSPIGEFYDPSNPEATKNLRRIEANWSRVIGNATHHGLQADRDHLRLLLNRATTER